MNFLSLYNSYDVKEVEIMRHNFREQFDAMCAQEKEYCARTGIQRRMDDPVARSVLQLLERCHSAFHVEALQRFILNDMEIPTWNELEERAHLLMTDALHV